MSGLSDEQRERLAPFDHGEYFCPRQRGACNDRCRKQHEDLYDVVAAIADEAAAETRAEIADRLAEWEFPAGSDALEPMYRLVTSLRARADTPGGDA